MVSLVIFRELKSNSSIDVLKNLGGWAKIADNAYLVSVNYTITYIQDILRFHNVQSKFIVIDASHIAWASYDMPPEVCLWMKNEMR